MAPFTSRQSVAAALPNNMAFAKDLPSASATEKAANKQTNSEKSYATSEEKKQKMAQQPDL